MTYLRMCKARNAMYSLKVKANDKLNQLKNKLNSCDGWFTILLAVLLCLAFTIVSALAIWCVTYKGSKFTGNWSWKESGISVLAECE